MQDYHLWLHHLPIDICETWMELDTYDAMTDYYKHLRTTAEIAECFQSCGLIDIDVRYAGNGVEAFGRRPGV
jgi:hypothetical protein